ncbi:carbon-nitrogen family hydrolase [Selenomonas ruminis]|uniref:Carbon-nitrogen family hydrolase n=1 Tax=Selenomonas ruminis TaxID=2593411 RepID=A0A5D6VTY7_9FIRM|nr:carbon-nitrogen family hydrolase [Selenomonas sp. mPRGC5]TYZ19541.1 carbon-nitrogen family hydrolase [Selenomonas sp. mPRGC5]
MKVAVLQMAVALGEPQKNIASLYRMAEAAMEDRPDILLLPELWPVGFYPQPILDYADADGRQMRDILSKLAASYQVNIVGGTVANAIGKQVFNTCYVFDRTGQLAATYHKTHLFTPSGEADDFEPGNSLVTVTLDGVKCGIAVCYDIRFPEFTRQLVLADISVLFLPAAWPQARLFHWQTLIRARAIENQIFVVACNEAGLGPHDTMLAGHSAIIDPWGEILAEAGEEECILQGNLRPAIRTQIKETMDVLADRRETLYQSKPKK